MTEAAAEIVAFCELSQAKARYCPALDTRNWQALAEIMTADVQFTATNPMSA
jgi:2-phospho-L-lactate guanylyltransferase (CobY/MobA/RfbA family)